MSQHGNAPVALRIDPVELDHATRAGKRLVSMPGIIGAPERAVTVQVDPGKRSIVQVRGRLNRAPTAEERAVLETWAAENGLRSEIG